MAKIQITACHLKELGQYAKGHGTEYAFVDLACDWAAQADVHLIKLEGLLQRCLPYLENQLENAVEKVKEGGHHLSPLEALITEIRAIHDHHITTTGDATAEVKEILGAVAADATLDTLVVRKGQDAT